jgi:PIN domain nuclease of toxin-antitoxin system
MNEVVLDASAILAIVFQERGAEKLTDEILSMAVASTVNLAEVQSKLIKKGYEPDEAWEDALSLVTAPEPFTSEQARIAGDLIAKTESRGLSLGDRSCLALAISLKAPVYTTEQIWKGLKVGVAIHVIR